MARGGKRGRPKMTTLAFASPTTSVSTLVETDKEDSTPRNNEIPIEQASHEERRPSYASMVDNDDGTKLHHTPTSIVNGKRITQIEKEDVAIEIEYWQSAVLCSVLGSNPPFEVMKGYINRIWSNFEIDKILMIKKGLFLNRFANLQDKILVENWGVYYFDKKSFIVKGWNQEMDLHTETIRSLPLWVQFPDLDLIYWGLDCLSKLGSLLSIPLKTDKYTKERAMIRYARLLIEIPIDGPFPEYIEFINEHGILTRQSVEYEWKPDKCEHCGMFGHLEDSCRKKQPRKEWRPVAKPQDHSEPKQANVDIPTEAAAGKNTVAEDGYISVTRKAAPKTSLPVHSPTSAHNSFHALMNSELVEKGE